MTDGVYRPELNITNYESRYREMDPKTEDLIPDGYELKEGMRVLIASPQLRNDTSHGFGRGDEINQKLLYQAKENNRWCVVSRLSPDFDNDRISFVGVYDDGTKRKRVYSRSAAWLVKLDSMKIDENGDELGNEKGCCIGCYTPSTRECKDSGCDCHEPKQQYPTCDHAISEDHQHCLVAECPNYLGNFIKTCGEKECLRHPVKVDYTNRQSYCSHAIDVYSPYCTIASCPNYAGRFRRS